MEYELLIDVSDAPARDAARIILAHWLEGDGEHVEIEVPLFIDEACFKRVMGPENGRHRWLMEVRQYARVFVTAQKELTGNRREVFFYFFYQNEVEPCITITILVSPYEDGYCVHYPSFLAKPNRGRSLF